MNITSVKYTDEARNTIRAIIDGQEMYIPTDPNNRHFAEIKSAEFRRELRIEEPDVAEPTLYPILTPRQFDWMLAYYDLEDVWNGVKADNKTAGSKAIYANLRASEKAGTYLLDDTLTFLQQVRDQPKIANSGIDLSDDAVRRYWRHASVQDFSSLLEVVPEPTE